MPLSDMYRTMLEASNPATWETNRQKQMMGEYELESKRRAMADEQRLRELYAGNAEPSIRDVMAISPELGIKLTQAQNEQYLKSLQAQETKGKIDLQAADQASAAAFPALVTYEENLNRGMSQDEALNLFHRMNGDAVSQAARQGATWVQSGSSYDPNKISPEDVRSLNARFNRFTPSEQLKQKAREEAMRTGYGIRQKQAPSYEDIYQKPVWDQQRGQWIYPGEREAPDLGEASASELNMMEKALKGMPDGPEKEGLIRFLNEKKGMPSATTPSSVRPMSEIKAEEAKAVETAKLEAGKEQTIKQREEILSSIPSRDEVEGLIDKSISSGVEQQLKGKIGPAVGMGSEALTATKQLDVIAPQLKSITKTLAGAGAISDFEQKMMADAAGAIADPNVPADARKAAFRTFMDIMDKADKSTTPKASGLQVGHEENGYIYKGGDPGKQSSWEKK